MRTFHGAYTLFNVCTTLSVSWIRIVEFVVNNLNDTTQNIMLEKQETLVSFLNSELYTGNEPPDAKLRPGKLGAVRNENCANIVPSLQGHNSELRGRFIFKIYT